jgi:hypothetical protein
MFVGVRCKQNGKVDTKMVTLQHHNTTYRTYLSSTLHACTEDFQDGWFKSLRCRIRGEEEPIGGKRSCARGCTPYKL